MSLDTRRLLPRLRHERWMGWTELPSRDLLELPIKGLPRVGVGEDSRDRFRFVQHADLDGPTAFAELEAIAIANLGKRPEFWNVREKSKGVFGIGARPTMLELVGEHAAERILDRAFMSRAHDLLNAQLLAVAIPVRGVLWARAAAASIDEMGAFIDLVRRAFQNAPSRLEPISPVVMTVKDGVLVGGVAAADPDIVSARGFPWPIDGQTVAPAIEAARDEDDEEDDLDEDDRRLRVVGYHPASKTLEYACCVEPGEAIPDAQVKWIAHLVKKRRVGRRLPVDTVRIACPDRRVAVQIAPQILPTGAQITFMNGRGQDIVLG